MSTVPTRKTQIKLCKKVKDSQSDGGKRGAAVAAGQSHLNTRTETDDSHGNDFALPVLCFPSRLSKLFAATT